MLLIFTSAALWAQWSVVNNGLPGAVPASMFSVIDTVVLGTAGSGIFKTTNQGENWLDITGNIGNKNINDIRGGGAVRVIWVATENGIFYTNNHSDYVNQTSTGLSVTDANYYWFGTEGEAEWAVGTNGAGLFISPDPGGPWHNAGNGLTGTGLIVNDLSGYEMDDLNYTVLATDNGVYFSDSSLSSWTWKSNGLSGNALHARKLSVLGSYILVATEGGLFYSIDYGENWNSFISGEKMNTVRFIQTALAPYGIAVMAFGTGGYISLDLLNFSPMDMTGVSGEVTCFALTSTELYIGADHGAGLGSVYKRALDQVVAIENNEDFSLVKSQLSGNYPNPFNPRTRISYQIGSPAEVELSVYNSRGQKVATLVSGWQHAGNYRFDWDAAGLASGIYYCHLKADQFWDSMKIVLIR